MITNLSREILAYYRGDIEICRQTWLSHSVKEVIFAPPATIVYWRDGTKTVVKCDEDDEFNEEIGFILCRIKKELGNKSNYNTQIRNVLKNAKRYYDKEETK